MPPGSWAVGVSGGADSVALLVLLRQRPDLHLHVAHLDHQTRSGESAKDAEFVADLSRSSNLPCTIARRSDIEKALAHLPSNRAARYRAARIDLFRRLCADHQLQGVLLAHHADDQAETIALRLLRGSGLAGLHGMRASTRVHDLTILRPLLEVRAADIRQFLRAQHIAWREDASNKKLDQRRNRLRALLQQDERMTANLLRLGNISTHWLAWLEQKAPQLPETFNIADLQHLFPPVAEFAARRWLAQRIDYRAEIPPSAARKLVDMTTDAAAPPRWTFPTGLLVRRRQGKISAHKGTAAQM